MLFGNSYAVQLQSQGEWNYDIRLSVETNLRLIPDAGFSDCAIQFDQSDNGSDCHAVLPARV